MVLARLSGFEGGSRSDLEVRDICNEIVLGFVKIKVLFIRKKRKKTQKIVSGKKMKSFDGVFFSSFS